VSRFSLLKMSSPLLMSISLMFAGGNLFAAQMNLTWDAVNDSSLQGYKIYCGTASRNYATAVNAGNVTSYAVTGLGGSTTYYFAVTAYNSTAESTFSDEVTYTTPAGTNGSKPCTYSLSSKGASFGWSGGAGSVAVSTPASCAWNSSTPPGWITITSGSIGTDNGTVVYFVAPNAQQNKIGSPRAADLTIAGQVFTVSQAGSAK